MVFIKVYLFFPHPSLFEQIFHRLRQFQITGLGSAFTGYKHNVKPGLNLRQPQPDGFTDSAFDFVTLNGFAQLFAYNKSKAAVV